MLDSIIISFDKYASPSKQGEDVYEVCYHKENAPQSNAFSMTKEEFLQLSTMIIDYFKSEVIINV